MSDCFVLYLLLTCMKKKTSGADKFTNNSIYRSYIREAHRYHYQKLYKIHWHRGRIYRRAALHD